MSKTGEPLVQRPMPVVVAICSGLAGLGFAVGIASAFAHAKTVEAGVRLPLGLLVALGALAGVALCAGLLTRSRAGVGVIALGWVVSVVVFTTPRAEGDVIVAATATGYGYLFGGVLVLTALSVVPYGALGA